MGAHRLLFACAFAVVALAGAPPAGAAPPPTRWCGDGPSALRDRPDVVSGNQVHAVYAIPADGRDRFFELAPAIARDLAAVDDWWQGQDVGRAPRFDLFSQPDCDTVFGRLDISFARLAVGAAASSTFEQSVRAAISDDLRSRGFSSLTKKYLVFYDGPIGLDVDFCGVSTRGPNTTGNSFVFVLVREPVLGGGTCGTVGENDWSALTAAHELLHNLGAVQEGAPHACPGGGHICGDPSDIMSRGGSEAGYDDLSAALLDPGRDDYYGHSGAWWDVADSAWLGPSVATLVQVALSVRVDGAGGTVTSDPAGVSCPGTCSASWLQGTGVTLTATAVAGFRFAGWGGACSGTAPTCSVSLDAAREVTAIFEKIPAKRDTTAPVVRALPSAGKPGSVIRLRYTVSDDSGKTADTIAVYRRTSLLMRGQTKLGPAVRGKVYYVRWSAPAAAKGPLRFCVSAADAAGNRSAPSCAAITLR